MLYYFLTYIDSDTIFVIYYRIFDVSGTLDGILLKINTILLLSVLYIISDFYSIVNIFLSNFLDNIKIFAICSIYNY